MINYYNENHISEVILSGGCEQRNLPSGYTQVEYLESNSQPYIDTGIAGDTNDLEIGCKFCYTKYFKFGAIYGNWTDDTYNVTRLILGTNSGKAILNNNRISEAGGNTNINLSINTIHTVVSQYTTYTIDGITATVTLTTTGSTNNNNIALFNRSATNPNTSRDIGLEVYSFYIKKSGTLVRNLIPCRRNSDNVLGMYDTVSGNFLTNAGTGTFTAGADVTTPSPDNPIDIMCNNGVLKVNRNLYSTEYHDKTLSQSDGVTTSSNTGVNVSAMVNCTNVKSFMVTSANPKGIYRLFKYRPDGTFIDAQTTADIGQVLVIPSDCGYFRIQYNYTSATVGTENILIYNSAYNLGIYTDGTVETINAHEKNFFNVSDYSSSSDWQGSGTYKYVEIPLPNGTYTVSWDKTKGAPNIYWLIQVRESVAGTSSSGIGGSWLWHATSSGLQKEKFTFTVTEGKAWFSCAFAVLSDFLPMLETVQIEHGSAATEYEPYFNGGTATAEMLLKVGDYTDTQKVIKGEVRRNVGIKVLDGTEYLLIAADTYIKSDACDAFFLIDSMESQRYNNCVLYCNIASVGHGSIWNTNGWANKITVNVKQLHLNIANDVLGITDYTQETRATALAKFKQYLANQYANGTPVIIVYPLEAPTTEEVDGQFLDGKCVEQISGAISNLPIEISNIHNLKKRYVTDSNGNATEITKIYKGDTLLWQK